MKTLFEIRAECLKHAEGGAVSSSESGGNRRPIRKRGFHRALKRGEPWAKLEKQAYDMMNKMAKTMFEKALEPSPWIGLYEGTLGVPRMTDKETK